MKVKIKSKFIYDCNCEELQEELEASVKITEENIIIKHNDGYIKIEYGKLTQQRNGNTMIIETGKTTECVYNTEHGSIMLKIEGLLVEKNVDDVLLCKAQYFISADGQYKYMVKLQIVLES